MRILLKPFTSITTLILIMMVVACAAKTVPYPLPPKKPVTQKLAGQDLQKFSGNYRACMTALNKANIDYTPIPDRVSPKGCELKDQITLDRSRYPYSAPVIGTCEIIAAVAAWEEQVVRKNALKFLGEDIKEITHYAMFSCRNIAGTSKRSEHSKGNAIDIAGFTMKNGDKIMVLDHWKDRGKKGQFLRTVFKDSCKIFKGAMGPNSNAAHRDHFHFDMGSWGFCD